jgi:hypothetical protein
MLGVWDSSVGTGLGGPGIESLYEQDFLFLSIPAHPASCTVGTGSAPGKVAGA